MLDNLFNTVLVLSFLTLCTYGALSNQPGREQARPEPLSQIETVVIIGQSVKASDPV